MRKMDLTRSPVFLSVTQQVYLTSQVMSLIGVSEVTKQT